MERAFAVLLALAISLAAAPFDKPGEQNPCPSGSSADTCAATLLQLGRTYRSQDRFDDAVRLYLRALDLRESAAGPDGVSLLPALNELGVIFLDMAQYDHAEAALRRAVAIAQNHAAESSTDGADALNNLGLVLRQQGRLTDAEKLYQRALAVYRQTSDLQRQTAVLNNLAVVLIDLRRYNEAGQMDREAIALAQQIAGNEDPEVAVGYGNLARLMIARRKFSAAERLLHRAEQIDRLNFPPNHSRIGYDLYLEGVATAGRQRYPEAERLYQQAEEILEKALPANHPEVGKLVAAWRTYIAWKAAWKNPNRFIAAP